MDDNFGEWVESIAGAYTLETHVTGVRAHGRCTMMVIDRGQFPHDSNITIEILLGNIQQLKVLCIMIIVLAYWSQCIVNPIKVYCYN